MPITPNPPADFNPQRQPQIELTPFRFWCQKVLPLVYDDSLSYYELLCKVVDYLNKTMEDVSNMLTDMDNIYTAYNKLQDYVNNYFSSLDVQEEINKKLDEMAKSGQLTAIINAYFSFYSTPELYKTTENSWSEAVQSCINDERKTKILSGTYEISSLNITNDIVLTGGGSLTVSNEITINNNNITITNLNINGTINIISTNYAKISDCRFKNESVHGYCFTVNANGVSQAFQRAEFTNCSFIADYDFYNIKDTSEDYMPYGDILFSNCTFIGYITSLRMYGVDGINITGCTFLTHTYRQTEYGNKLQHIYISNSNFVNICNNSFFECGSESIRLITARAVIINGNQLSWGGQVNPSYAIFIQGTSGGTAELNGVMICNNIINYNSGGFLQLTNSRGIVNNNYVAHLYSNRFYFGTKEIPSNQSSIALDDTTKITTPIQNNWLSSDIPVTDIGKNFYYSESQNKSNFFNHRSQQTIKTSFTGTLEATELNYIQANCTIENITSLGVEGVEILIIPSNNATITVKNSTNIILKDNTDMTLTSGCLHLIYVNNRYYEM